MKKFEYFSTDNGVLYCGDCLEILPLLTDKVDLIWTSPPYNLGKFIRNGRKNVYDNYAGNDMDEKEYREWLISCFSFVPKMLANQGNFALNLKYRYKDNQCILPHWIIDKINMTLRNEIIWKYNGYVDVNNKKFFPGHENIFVFCADRQNRYFNSKYAKLGDVWNINPAIRSDGIFGKIHPAPFPTQLANIIIQALCPLTGITLDPFLGSGTTAVACEKLNRRWIGIEISEKYCEIAKARIKAEAEQIKMFERTII